MAPVTDFVTACVMYNLSCVTTSIGLYKANI
jgi:hypothetical protein